MCQSAWEIPVFRTEKNTSVPNEGLAQAAALPNRWIFLHHTHVHTHTQNQHQHQPTKKQQPQKLPWTLKTFLCIWQKTRENTETTQLDQLWNTTTDPSWNPIRIVGGWTPHKYFLTKNPTGNTDSKLIFKNTNLTGKRETEIKIFALLLLNFLRLS